MHKDSSFSTFLPILVIVSQSALCACWSISSLRLQLCHSLYFLLQSLTLGNDCEDLFWSWACLHVCGILDNQEYAKLFKTPYELLMPPLFLVNIFVCLPQQLQTADCFWQMLLGKRLLALGKLWVRPNKEKPWKWVFWKLPVSSYNSSCLKMGLWKSSNPVLTPLVAARVLVSTMFVSHCFLRLSWSWGDGDGIEQVKMPQTYCFQWDSAIKKIFLGLL